MQSQTNLESSPVIGCESTISNVPIFAKKMKSSLHSFMSTPKRALKSPLIKPRQLEISKAPLIKYLKPVSFDYSKCECTHALIADDDPFQHLYYQNLFQKSMDFDQFDIKQQDFRATMCSSGEELLFKLRFMQKCGCKKLRIIITDYQMGAQKLTGAQTARRVRESGYTGPVILRTGEDRADLLKLNKDLEEIVTCIVEKSDSKKGKEMITKFLRQRISI